MWGGGVGHGVFTKRTVQVLTLQSNCRESVTAPI